MIRRAIRKRSRFRDARFRSAAGRCRSLSVGTGGIQVTAALIGLATC